MSLKAPVEGTASWLGRAGLVPFVALPCALALDSGRSVLWQKTLGAYAFGILCFLLGAWWGLALVKRHPFILVLSNVLFLALVASFVTLSGTGLYLATAAMFAVMVMVERRHALFKPQPDYYARLRAQLSLVASVALCVAAIVSWSPDLQPN